MTTWPNLEIDRIAASQALEEMGEDCPLTKVLARAQELKDRIQACEECSGWGEITYTSGGERCEVVPCPACRGKK